MKRNEAFAHGLRLVLATCMGFLGLLCLLSAAPAQALRPRVGDPEDADARFDAVPCPETVRASAEAFAIADVTCGFIEVPEHYDRVCRRADTLRLFVVVAKTQAPNPGAPVLFLAGGPGQSLTTIAGQVFGTGAMGRVRAQRDIVLIDPRGAGYSEPRLTCPQASASAPVQSGPAQLTPLQRESLRCARALEAQGIDLTAYDTTHLARDVKRIRAALRAPKVALYAVSYGALLGLQTLRDARDWIESAVLVSMPRAQGGTVVRAGQSAQEALDTFARTCAAQSACAAYGDVTANLDALLAQLDAQPLDLGRVSSTGQGLVLTSDLLGRFVQGAFGSPALGAILPKAVALALQGDGALWLPHVEAMLAPPPAFDFDQIFSLPLHNSIWCSEELVFGSVDEMRRRAAASDAIVRRYFFTPLEQEYETCEVWPVPEAPRSFYAPVVTDIPVYLIGGALDQMTRPSFSQDALRGLRNAQLTVFADAGHLAAEFAACGPELVARFFERPGAPIDDRCAATPVQFAP